jgi:hypothetical protein
MRASILPIRAGIASLALVVAAAMPARAQQAADSGFDPRVEHPAYTSKHPKVLFDEAHYNFHKASGRYKPFADLITNDGCRITPNTQPFTRAALDGFDVLVISNAVPKNRPTGLRVDSAFTPEECAAVREWVRAGGGLLLIADHWPLSVANAELAAAFGVEVSRIGFAADSANAEPGFRDESRLVFSRDNGLLRDHPITRGREARERLNRVVTFTGQSLRGPRGSVAFLALGPAAMDVATADIMGPALDELAPDQRQVPAGDRAQGIALVLGRGRVVVLGEAAMLTAQQEGDGRFGMNAPGNDDRQLALNIVHWLTKLLD